MQKLFKNKIRSVASFFRISVFQSHQNVFFLMIDNFNVRMCLHIFPACAIYISQFNAPSDLNRLF